MIVEELRAALAELPPSLEVVGEECFKGHHNLRLVHAGVGQDGKFVLFFKDKSIKDFSIKPSFLAPSS